VPEFLSPEWVAALDAAVRASAELATDETLVVEQVVEAAGSTAVRYQVRFGPDGASVIDAGTDLADVVLVTDRATAWALHTGERRAQDAFARGDLKVRGRPEALVGRAELFARFERAAGTLRAGTTNTGDR
jgi:hypothetical protein